MFHRPWRAAIAALTSALVVAGAVPAPASGDPTPSTTAVVAPTQQLTGATRPVPVHGDFDGDGRDDIFWYVAGSGTDYLWSGKSRTTPTTITPDRFDVQTLGISGSYTPVAGDFDGDGRDDIFWYGKGSLPDSVWYFTGRGTVHSKPVTLNGDYKLIAANFNTTGASAAQDDIFLHGPGYASLWSGTSSRTFTNHTYTSPPPKGARAYAGNWRQSPTSPGATVHQDLLFYRPGTASDVIWVGTGTTTFTTSAITINGSYDPIVGNFDTSSGPEMTDVFWYAPGTAKDSVWMNTGSGFTSIAQTVNGTTYKPVVLAARGAEAQDDILWNNPSGADFIWKMTGSNRAFSHQSRTLAQIGATDPGTRTPLVADFNTTEPVAGTTMAATLAAGHDHACAVTTTGGAQCWGSGSSGQLGNGATADTSVPGNVTGLTSGVASITSGKDHSCAVTTAGGVTCWGLNADGQLGNGANTNSNVPVEVTGLSTGVVAASAGPEHTCAITTTGGVKCWGGNSHGQLGRGNTTGSNVPVDVTGLTDVTAISVGAKHTCALTTSGGVTCWGGNSYGQLGRGNTTSSTTPVDVTGLTTGVTAMDVGRDHSCAITAGATWCWGRNFHGQLGNGNTGTNATAPVAVSGLTDAATINLGYDQSCVVTTATDPYAYKCWGSNAGGAFGDSTTTNSNTPVTVHIGAPIAQVSGGYNFGCLSLTNGVTGCWGVNANGRTGLGLTSGSTLYPTQVFELSTADVGASPGVPGNAANVDLLWWTPGNGAGQNEILWAELEAIS